MSKIKRELGKAALYIGIGVALTMASKTIDFIKEHKENHSKFTYVYRKDHHGYARYVNGDPHGGIGSAGEINLSLRDIIEDSSYLFLSKDSTFFNYLERIMEEESDISLDDKVKKLKIVVKK